jgi:hypothetical protein
MVNAPAGTLSAQVIHHHLRLFGAARALTRAGTDAECAVLVLDRPGEADVDAARNAARAGRTVTCLQPSPGFCRAFGVTAEPAPLAPPACAQYELKPDRAWSRLRTLHTCLAFAAASCEPIVTCRNQVLWCFVACGHGALLLVGTDLAGDLIRYRQGDPARALQRPADALWGIPGERPVYLFEDQLAGEPPHERHADWWAMALAETIAAKLGAELEPVLPNGVPGAVVLTGDDDQAYLDKYDEQLAIIGETPITYFLHPLTRHTRQTLGRFGRHVDLGLHPDALEAPERYGELFAQQCAWFTRLTGKAPLSVRNHGYLNDGYWGHLDAWRRAGARISSNLPGLDGRVLNGSLLPARVAANGALTPHWSLLAAIGDGVRFILGMSDEGAGDCVTSLGERVLESGVPGVIVLNLHPQNVAETRGMHRAALGLIERGFIAWNVRDCLRWFERRDGSGEIPRSSFVTRLLSKWMPHG